MSFVEIRLIGTKQDVEDVVNIFRESERIVYEGRYSTSRKVKNHVLKYIKLRGLERPNLFTTGRKGKR